MCVRVCGSVGRCASVCVGVSGCVLHTRFKGHARETSVESSLPGKRKMYLKEVCAFDFWVVALSEV